MMGVYGMVIGFFKLGFLLEFVSIPISTGFISAVAITIMLNQMGALFGTDVSSSAKAYTQIRQVFELLPQASGMTCAIGFSGIVLLKLLEEAGKRWGGKNKVIWMLSIMRAFIALVLFTGISYAVNHNLDPKRYLWTVVKLSSGGQEAPSIPSLALLSRVASGSLAVFIGAAIEHTAIARAFGIMNNYTPDQSQELCYFGVVNFFNSFFHAMGVGGAMSRTSVNSQCKVRSPLSGVVVTAVILICMYFLAGALYWIPKTTLAAIIILAVWPLIHPPSAFYRFWKTSLADFISSMLAFWLTLFVSTEYGIFVSVGFNIVYNILRQTFTSITASSAPALSELTSSLDAARGLLPGHTSDDMLQDVHVSRFSESFFFPNSYRTTQQILDSIQTHHSPVYDGSHGAERERNWSVTSEKRIGRLRKAAGVSDMAALPPIGLVVLDFGRVNHIDTTAVAHLKTLVAEIRRYSGKNVVFRFVDMTSEVHSRFQRAGWPVVDAQDADAEMQSTDTEVTKLYKSVVEAVMAPRWVQWDFGDVEKSDTVKSGPAIATHKEHV